MYMTHRLFLAALLVCFLGSHSRSQPAEVSVTRMGNGLTLILQEDHSTELVGVAVWVKAGSGSETPENNGVSHFIEHLVFGATAKRAPGEMDLEMESVGATLDARTSRDWAHFDTTVSSRYLSKALDVLADAMTTAQFRHTDVQRERRVILDEIARKETAPFSVCKDLLAKELYGTHPYGLTVEGTRDSVKRVARQDILDYYRKYYVPGNMAVVLVGDIDKQRAAAEVGRAFQGAPSAPAPKDPARPIAPVSGQVNKFVKGPFPLHYLAIGFLGPPASDYADVCATDVMLSHVGFGYRSWMSHQLKDKMGLAVDVRADFLTQRDPGMVSLVAATTSANRDKVKGAIFARLASIRSEGISAGDLGVAKRSLLGQFAFQNETFGGRANAYGFYFAASDPAFAERYVDCVRSVTNEDIIRVAQKYLDPRRAVVMTVVPDQEYRE